MIENIKKRRTDAEKTSIRKYITLTDEGEYRRELLNNVIGAPIVPISDRKETIFREHVKQER